MPYAAEQLPPFPLWVLLVYYAIVVSRWLWNQWAAGAEMQPISATLHMPKQFG
jgi:competence protein ComEC